MQARLWKLTAGMGGGPVPSGPPGAGKQPRRRLAFGQISHSLKADSERERIKILAGWQGQRPAKHSAIN
jgi:hypothetical protein